MARARRRCLPDFTSPRVSTALAATPNPAAAAGTRDAFLSFQSTQPSNELVRLRDAPSTEPPSDALSPFPRALVSSRVRVRAFHLQTRVRSWTAGRGHNFAVPATRDPISGKFFAALDAPGSDPALVAWGDGDPVASLDALISGSTARLVGGVAALVPAGNVQGGGVLAVDSAGTVRWFGEDARKLAASAGDASDAAVEAATPEAGGGGVLVVTRVTPKERRAKKKDTRVATLYRAAGSDDAGRRVERAWRVEVRPPSFAADQDTDGNAASIAPRVVAAAAEGDALTLVWSDGFWASYDPHAEDPGAPVRELRLGGGEKPAANRAGGKRGATERGEKSHAGALPHASAASLGGGYFAVATATHAGGASVAVLDARFGGVHAHQNVEAAGGAGGVSLAALSDGDDGSFRVALCLVDAVALVDLPAPAPVSLAAALGARSAAARGAAARALGRANAAAAAAPPRVGVATLEPEALLAAASRRVGEGEKPASFASGAVVEVDLAGLALDGDDDGDATGALAALEREGVTAAEAATALAPFARLGEGRQRSKSKRGATRGGAAPHSGEVPMPPAVLSAALDTCVRNRLWGPLRDLVDAGFVTSSNAAPGMVRALLEADRLEDVETFVSSAADVSAEDLRRYLDSILSEPGTCAFAASPASLAASRERRVAAAEAAAAAAKRESERGETSPAALRAAARDARIAAAAVESFDATDMPWAFALHAVVSRPIDPIAAANALPSLSPAATAKLASFASTWLQTYADLAASCDVSGASAPRGVPSLPTIVGWLSALIDARFTSLAVEGSMGDGDGGGAAAAAAAATRATRAAADQLSAACDAVGKIGGALAHVAEGAAVPEHQGVLSTTYSIEVVDW